MEIADLTESIKTRHPELRELNSQDFATHIDQLWGSMLKAMISKIVIALKLNTMVWGYRDDLFTDTNQAQKFAELWNYDSSFRLIRDVCCTLLYYDLSENEEWARWNIFRLISYLDSLLFKDNFSLKIWTSSGNIIINSIHSRKVLIFFLLEYWAEIDALRNWLDQFIEGQWCSETAEIL